MSELRQTAGLTTRVWVAGKFVSRDAVPVQISPKRFETKTRTSNLATRIDRVFTLAGMPNVRNRREIVLPWANLHEPGLLEHLDILAAIGQPFGLGLWKQEYDVFDGDAASLTFYLQRRQLLPAVTPPTTFPNMPTRVIVYDKAYTDPTATPTELTVTQKSSSTIDTGDPSAGEAWVESDGEQIGNLWISKLRLNVANVPPDAHDCLVAIYLPLYEVLVDQEAQRSYGQSLVEPRGLKFIEFG
jgi:hypothetical protein